MARLYDRMLRDRIRPSTYDDPVMEESEKREHEKEVRQNLLKADVIVADNVGDYFWGGNDKEYWEPSKDFGCVAPPASAFWIEAQKPKVIRGDRGTFDRNSAFLQSMPSSYGMLFGAYQNESKRLFDRFIEKRRYHRQEEIPMNREACLAARWVLHGNLYVELDREVYGSQADATFWLDSDGNCIEYSLHSFLRANSPAHEFFREHTLTGMDNFYYVALLALSFMNCRNVSSPQVTPPAALSKKHQRNYGRPLTTYRVLEINPVRRIAESPRQGGGKTGITQALHMVRGHFAEYTPDKGTGKGLFGRGIYGRFFIPQHIRGGDEERTVIKEYKIGRVSG